MSNQDHSRYFHKNIFVGRRFNQLKAITVCYPANESNAKPTQALTEMSITSTEPSSTTTSIPTTSTTTENSSMTLTDTTARPKTLKKCTVKLVSVIAPSYHSIDGIKMYLPVKTCSGKKDTSEKKPRFEASKTRRTHQIFQQDIETSTESINHFLRN